MKKKVFILPLLFWSLHAQISVSDISQIGNQGLDEIKEKLSSEQNELNKIEKANDVESIPVEIFNKNNEKINNEYFGYNYFQSNINFFDNTPTPTDYKLGAGDEIVLSLWGETNLRERFIINKDGLIFYENIGFINLSNKTVKEAESHLANELSKIYSTLKDNENPTSLMIELGKLKSLNIYFSGEIAKPGIQLVHPFSDIFMAIVQAGGVNLEGSLRNIQLIRNGKVAATVDFYDLFSKGINDFSNLRLIDGDIINIPAIENRVKIEGAVLRPGFYELLQSEELSNLIDYAAGLNPRASSFVTIDTIKPINERKSQDDIISSLNVDILNDKVLLNNGDLVFVREVGESASKIEIFGRVKVPGKYSATNMSLKNVLDIAGGFDDPIFRKSINDDIVILRKDESEFYSKEFTINYNDADSFPLKIDDKIFVYENINYRNSYTYQIKGEINKPGTYSHVKGITLREAINRADGLTKLTNESNISIKIQFTDIDENGNKVSVFETIGSPPMDFELDSNSIIDVLPSENVIKVEGNVYSPGLVAYQKGITMHEAIVQAGGYKPYSLKKRAYIKKINGEVVKPGIIFGGRVKRLLPGDTIVVPLNPNPSDFDITTFVADISTTLANIAAILLIVDNQNN